MNEAQKIARARRKVEAITGFYVHAFVFAVVLLGLLAVNLTSTADWWVHWVALGWGLGVALHAALVYGSLSERVTSWQLRKIHRLRSQM